MTVSDLTAAMAKANADMTAPKKTKRNPHFGSMYADVADVEAAVRPVWKKHGLSWRYEVTTEPGHLVVALVVLHTSGETLHLPGVHAAPPADPQKLISAVTYFKRVVLSAAAGVSADDDDDGNAAADDSLTGRDVVATAGGGPKQGPQADRPPTQKQLEYLNSLLERQGWSSRESRLAFVAGEVGREIGSSKDLTRDEVSTLIEQLKDTPPAERDKPTPGEPPDDPWAQEAGS